MNENLTPGLHVGELVLQRLAVAPLSPIAERMRANELGHGNAHASLRRHEHNRVIAVSGLRTHKLAGGYNNLLQINAPPAYASAISSVRGQILGLANSVDDAGPRWERRLSP